MKTLGLLALCYLLVATGTISPKGVARFIELCFTNTMEAVGEIIDEAPNQSGE